MLALLAFLVASLAWAEPSAPLAVLVEYSDWEGVRPPRVVVYDDHTVVRWVAPTLTEVIGRKRFSLKRGRAAAQEAKARAHYEVATLTDAEWAAFTTSSAALEAFRPKKGYVLGHAADAGALLLYGARGDRSWTIRLVDIWDWDRDDPNVLPAPVREWFTCVVGLRGADARAWVPARLEVVFERAAAAKPERQAWPAELPPLEAHPGEARCRSIPAWWTSCGASRTTSAPWTCRGRPTSSACGTGSRSRTCGGRRWGSGGERAGASGYARA